MAQVWGMPFGSDVSMASYKDIIQYSFAALKSSHSGATEPAQSGVKEAGMLWYDTVNSKLKVSKNSTGGASHWDELVFAGVTPTSPILFPDGAEDLPGAAFGEELSSGLYRADTRDVRMSIDETWIQSWTDSGVSFSVPLTASGASVFESLSTVNEFSIVKTVAGEMRGLTLRNTSNSSSATDAIYMAMYNSSSSTKDASRFRTFWVSNTASSENSGFDFQTLEAGAAFTAYSYNSSTSSKAHVFSREVVVKSIVGDNFSNYPSVRLQEDGSAGQYAKAYIFHTAENDEDTVKNFSYIRFQLNGVVAGNEGGEIRFYVMDSGTLESKAYINGSGTTFENGQIFLPDGTVGLPALAFSSAYNGGFYYASSSICAAFSGAIKWSFNASLFKHVSVVEIEASDSNELLTLDQNNSAGAFIDFEGTDLTDQTATLSSYQGGAGGVVGPFAESLGLPGYGFYRMARMRVNGVLCWIALYIETAAGE